MIPLETAEIGLNALSIAKDMVKLSNKNALSDCGVGSLMIHSGIKGALLNVKTNLQGLKDETLVASLIKRCERIENDATSYHKSIMEMVEELMG